MPTSARGAQHLPAPDRRDRDVPHRHAQDGRSGPSRRGPPGHRRRAGPNALHRSHRRDGSPRSVHRPSAGRHAPHRSPDAAHGARRFGRQTNAPRHQVRHAPANPHHPPRDAAATAGHRSRDRPATAHRSADRTRAARRSHVRCPVAHRALNRLPDHARHGHRGSTQPEPGRQRPRHRGPCLQIHDPRRHRFRGPRRHPGDPGTSRHVSGHRSASEHGNRPSPPRRGPVLPPKDRSLSVLQRRTSGCRPHRPISSHPGDGRPPSDGPRRTSRAVHPTCSAAHRNRTRSQRPTPSDARHPHRRVPRPRCTNQRSCPDAGRARRATTARQRRSNPHVPVLLIARHRGQRHRRHRDRCPPNPGATGYGLIRTRRSGPCRPARCAGRLCSRVCRSSMVVPQSPRPRTARRSAKTCRLGQAPHLRAGRPIGAAPAPTGAVCPTFPTLTQRPTTGPHRARLNFEGMRRTVAVGRVGSGPTTGG